MISVREAKKALGNKLDGGKIYGKIFDKDEIERAETIVNALEGLTIVSAQELLSKVNDYLLNTTLS